MSVYYALWYQSRPLSIPSALEKERGHGHWACQPNEGWFSLHTYLNFFLDTRSLVLHAASPHLHTQQLPFPHLPGSISLHTFLKMYNQWKYIWLFSLMTHSITSRSILLIFYKTQPWLLPAVYIKLKVLA